MFVMSKNLIPLLIVSTVIFVGGFGIYLLLNQQDQVQSDLNLNITPNPTNAIINRQSTKPAPTLNMNDFIATTSGLKIKDEVIGSGAEAKAGDTVTVNYLGTLENGTKFDSSYDRNTPFSTQIGVGKVIKGWDEGIVGMKVGGKRILVIPSDLAYGDQGQGPIPPKATLIFQVELLGIK